METLNRDRASTTDSVGRILGDESDGDEGSFAAERAAKRAAAAAAVRGRSLWRACSRRRAEDRSPAHRGGWGA